MFVELGSGLEGYNNNLTRNHWSVAHCHLAMPVTIFGEATVFPKPDSY